jgi:methylaspartate ammonia-lyase
LKIKKNLNYSSSQILVKTMPTKKIILEFTEKDLIELIASRYNLDTKKTSISVYTYKGDAREASYSKITVTGEEIPYNDRD